MNMCSVQLKQYFFSLKLNYKLVECSYGIDVSLLVSQTSEVLYAEIDRLLITIMFRKQVFFVECLQMGQVTTACHQRQVFVTSRMTCEAELRL